MKNIAKENADVAEYYAVCRAVRHIGGWNNTKYNVPW